MNWIGRKTDFSGPALFVLLSYLAAPIWEMTIVLRPQLAADSSGKNFTTARCKTPEQRLQLEGLTRKFAEKTAAHRSQFASPQHLICSQSTSTGISLLTKHPLGTTAIAQLDTVNKLFVLQQGVVQLVDFYHFQNAQKSTHPSFWTW